MTTCICTATCDKQKNTKHSVMIVSVNMYSVVRDNGKVNVFWIIIFFFFLLMGCQHGLELHPASVFGVFFKICGMILCDQTAIL